MATQETTQRPLFFEGQYLRAEDLETIIEYFRTQAARHVLGAHTWGIAPPGLELQEGTPSDDGSVNVFIMPGYAWDGFGRPIVVSAPFQLPVEKFTSQPAGLVKVWLRYAEKQTLGVRQGFEVCDVANPLARVDETFEVVVGEKQMHTPIVVAGYDLVKAIEKLKLSVPTGTPTSQFNPMSDGSVPYQIFPKSGDKADWLIPLGSVSWVPSTDPKKPGHFKPLDPAAEKPKSEAQRLYTSWMTDTIAAVQGIIRLRDPNPDPNKAPLRVLIEKGNLDVEGDVSLFKNENHGNLYFYNSNNRDAYEKEKENEKQLYLRRVGTSLQAIIGNTQDDKFEIGPVNIKDNCDAIFSVQGDGVLRVGGSEIKDTPKDTSGKNKGRLSIKSGSDVVAFDGDDRVVIGGDTPDHMLTIQSNDTKGTYLNIKNIATGTPPPEPSELVVGATSDSGIIQSGKNLKLQAGGELVITKPNSSSPSQPPINILTIENEASSPQSATNLTNPQAGSDLQFKTTDTSSSSSPTMRMVIKANGSVGIGVDTTNPINTSRKLHVIGDLLCKGKITGDTIEGTFLPINTTFTSLTANSVTVGSDNTSGSLQVNRTSGALPVLKADTTGTTINGSLTVASTPVNAKIEDGEVQATKVSVVARANKDGEVAANSVTVGSSTTDGSLTVQNKASIPILTITGTTGATINGPLTVTGSRKNFTIHDKDTSGKDRYFVCATRVSSNDQADLYWRKRGELVNAKSVDIKLDDFDSLANGSDTITVQLTPIFKPGVKMLAASEVTKVNNEWQFTVTTIDETQVTQSFYWEVKAVMK